MLARTSRQGACKHAVLGTVLVLRPLPGLWTPAVPGCLGTALPRLTGLLGLLLTDTQREQGPQNTHVQTGRVLGPLSPAIGGDTRQLPLVCGGLEIDLDRGPQHVRR